MRLRFTRRAERDLEAIAEYIAKDSPGRALSFVQGLRRRCTALLDFPASTMLRTDIADGIRVAVHSRYLILYAARDGHLVIERVVHGARYLPDPLGAERSSDPNEQG